MESEKVELRKAENRIVVAMGFGKIHWRRDRSRETGIPGNFVGRIKGAKYPFDLQFLTWDFS